MSIDIDIEDGYNDRNQQGSYFNLQRPGESPMEEKRIQTEPDNGHENQSYDSRIQETYHSLSRNQKKIANYILKNKRSVIQSSITMLAKKIGTTPATITRFCQALRYQGYKELKFYMEHDMIPSSDERILVSQEDSLPVIIRKMLKYHTDALNDTLLLLDEGKLKQAIALIVKADKVYFYAEGGTGSSAQFAYHLFLQIGVTSNCFTDSSLMLMSTSHLTSRDVVICMSYSGAAEDVLTAVRFAKKNKASVIAMTAHPNSRFAKASDILLSYSCNLHDDLRYLHTARMCEIAIIGILQTGIVNHMIHQNDNRLADLKYAITSKRTK